MATSLSPVGVETTVIGTIESNGPSVDCDASCHCDDSDAKVGTEDATGANVDDEFYQLADYRSAYATFVQDCLRRHLKVIESAIDLVEDTGDIGIVVRSIRKMCYHIESNDGAPGTNSPYDLGDGGDWRNDVLECVLGMVGDDRDK